MVIIICFPSKKLLYHELQSLARIPAIPTPPANVLPRADFGVNSLTGMPKNTLPGDKGYVPNWRDYTPYADDKPKPAVPVEASGPAKPSDLLRTAYDLRSASRSAEAFKADNPDWNSPLKTDFLAEVKKPPTRVPSPMVTSSPFGKPPSGVPAVVTPADPVVTPPAETPTAPPATDARPYKTPVAGPSFTDPEAERKKREMANQSAMASKQADRYKTYNVARDKMPDLPGADKSSMANQSWKSAAAFLSGHSY